MVLRTICFPLFALGDSWTKRGKSEAYNANHTYDTDTDCIRIMQSPGKDYKGVFLLFTLTLIVSMSVLSFKLVVKYHNNVPAPIQLIQFIERQFNNISTRIYCNNEKRFFDYYAPQWDVRTVRDRTELNSDLLSSLGKPRDILVVHTSGEMKQFGITNPPMIKFKETHTPIAQGKGCSFMC